MRYSRTGVWTISILIGLVLAFLSVRAAAVRLLPPTSPVIAAVNPGYHERALWVVTDAILRTDGGIDQEARQRAILAARSAPLDERPYLVAAIDAFVDEREAVGVELLEAARARNPRNQLVRLLLMDRYLAAGRIAAASSEMSAVNRLLPASHSLLVSELAKLAVNPSSRTATRAALIAEPTMFEAVLAYTARTDPDTALRLAGADAPPGTQPGGWRRVLVDALLQAGRVEQAQREWQRSSGISSDGDRNVIFDPAFTGTGGPPFGWTFVSSDIGTADGDNGQLSLEFFGRRPGMLASQLVVARPGRYLLSYAAEGSDGGEVGSVAVSLACAGEAPRPLANLPVPKLGAARRSVQTELDIPADCASQTLQIVGTAGEFASPTSAVISQLSLAPLGTQ